MAIARGALIAAGVSCALASTAASDELTVDDLTGDARDVTELSLEDLLVIETGVATRSGKPLRETPGVVTVITRDEIARSGARDLLDVLVLVPGFSAPGVDVEGAINVGFRGVWGHEGKILLLIDGLEMNEDLFSTLQLGNHYPLHNVERIEVIRGPGSAVYGGYAELAVINVITRGGRGMSGSSVQVSLGQRSDGLGHRTLSMAFGQPIGDDGELSLAMTGGQGSRSGRDFVDIYGDSFDMSEQSAMNPFHVNGGLRLGGFKLRAIYDDYGLDALDGFDAIQPRAIRLHFETLTASAEYAARPVAGLTITPRIAYKRTSPWGTKAGDTDLYYLKSNRRYTGGLAVAYDVTEDLGTLVGGEVYHDRAEAFGDPDLGFGGLFAGDQREVSYTNLAGYAQVLYDNPLANLAVGARLEQHSEFGTSFVPRAALTRVLGRAHVKLLASRAFRAPGIENISLFQPNPERPDNDSIDPERTTTYELEVGVALSPGLYVGANLFDITIDQPIVYFFDEATGTEGYTNFDQTGSRGGELEVKNQHGRGAATFTYSFHHEAGKNQVPFYAARDGRVLLGMPAHKLTLREDFDLTRSLGLHASAVYLSDRWAYTHVDDEEISVQENLGSTLLVDAFLRARDLGLRGLDLGVGVKNIFAEDFVAAQPYDGYHAPLPMFDRELMIRLQYRRALD
jgi:outer membrane receptor for ferrienterochelin and colicin